VASTHPDLGDDLVGEQCFCANTDGTGCCPGGGRERSGAGSAEDDHGHGSNVSGIVTSAGRVAPAGVAPDAKLVAVKVLDSQNRFSGISQVLAGLDWVLATRPDVRVVNMSLGTGAQFEGYCDRGASWTVAVAEAIGALRARGTLAFACSMNTGSPRELAAPACIAGVVAVGATYDSDFTSATSLGCTDAPAAADAVTCFSNSGVALDLLAPGAPITSAGLSGGRSTFRGTSQASPHAAGAAALLLELNPGLGPDQLEALLVATGRPVLDPRNGLTFPRVDVAAAATRAAVGAR
jgi:subtilisin family serine protease